MRTNTAQLFMLLHMGYRHASCRVILFDLAPTICSMFFIFIRPLQRHTKSFMLLFLVFFCGVLLAYLASPV